MSKQDKSMWNKVSTMPESEVEANAISDPDNAPADDMLWADVDNAGAGHP